MSKRDSEELPKCFKRRIVIDGSNNHITEDVRGGIANEEYNKNTMPQADVDPTSVADMAYLIVASLCVAT